MNASPFKKVLVCNRGEIAIRVFRSCTELGIRTVAIYSHEDRFSLHRYKADEAYQTAAAGEPLRAYLDVARVIEVAIRAEVDAIHPGYGFLSERVELREACEAHGITFVGPSADTLRIAGDKRATKELAERCGVPIIPGTSDLSTLDSIDSTIGYPVMVKAAFGGGGRGMRIVRSEAELRDSVAVASNEAQSSFGRGDVFIEKFLESPKHIEVQLLGDGNGNVLHLFERDCSVQRRHQKVLEVAPAVGLAKDTRDKLLEYALRLGRELKLLSAATAEFLVDGNGGIYFIEINPRIQVEHTVTEEITGIDIVQSQLQLAAGRSLEELSLRQSDISCHGVAIQARITSENPRKDFMPDYGRLVAYRSASGFGIRLDAGSAFTGAEILPYYDSLLVKITSRGRSMPEAASRMRRALSEFRIRGVSTNIAFLENLLRHPEFLGGKARVTFLEDHPEVLQIPERKDRANRLLKFLAEVSVNGHESMKHLTRPTGIRDPEIPAGAVHDFGSLLSGPVATDAISSVVPSGWRDVLRKEGKSVFLKRIRDEKRLLITDTTFRDAHQSLLATRLRTYDMLRVAEQLAVRAPQLFSLEMWGGATFDVLLRFLGEDPWERLVRLRAAVPNIPFQLLLRGANIVGYTTYPDNVIRRFTEETYAAGVDIFRIFDALNDIERMQSAIDAVHAAGGVAEVCLCYTGDILNEGLRQERGEPSKYTLDYYRTLAKDYVRRGAEIIAIKDMAGLLRPYAASVLIDALRNDLDVPIHFHTHDTAGAQSAAYLKASEAGVDIVDCAFASMSGGTSQPSLEGIVAAMQNSERDTGLDLASLTEFSSYWESVRGYYQPFESDLKAATGDVYLNEIPGGQYSNFRPQAESLGLSGRWRELKRVYAEVNTLFGDIIKVTPTSKVVGDMAIFMLSNELTANDVSERAATLDFPASVIEFFRGDLGVPYGGFPEPLRTDILRGTPPKQNSLALENANFEEAEAQASALLGMPAGIRMTLSYLLYPHVFKEYAERRRQFGNVLPLPTLAYFFGLAEGEEIQVDIEPGKTLFISLAAISEPAENGVRTVFFELNGQPRSIEIQDRSIATDLPGLQMAEVSNPNHIACPLAGVVVRVEVKPGDRVEKDQALLVIEAMKMQTVVRASREGAVATLAVSQGSKVQTGQLLAELATD